MSPLCRCSRPILSSILLLVNGINAYIKRYYFTRVVYSCVCVCRFVCTEREITKITSSIHRRSRDEIVLNYTQPVRTACKTHKNMHTHSLVARAPAAIQHCETGKGIQYHRRARTFFYGGPSVGVAGIPWKLNCANIRSADVMFVCVRAQHRHKRQRHL